MVGCGSLQMVSKPIADLGVRVCLAPGCLLVWFRNPVGHNKNVVSA